MKTNKYITLLSIMLLAFIGCSDDKDKVFYNPDGIETNTLGAVKDSYFLNQDEASKVIDTFRWGKLDFGYQAAITYVLQIDLQGKEFANPQEVTSTSRLEADVTVEALNKSMLALQRTYKFVHATQQEVEFRVLGRISEATEGIHSNALPSKVTPYFTFPKVWIIGDYCGWDHGSTQFLYAFDDEKPNRLEAWVDFNDKAANGFKLTGAADWDNGNWGVKEGQSVEPEAKEIVLWDDGGSQDIKAYSRRFYKLGFDKNSLTVYNLYSMDSFGILGSALDNELEMSFDEKEQEFTITTTFKKGDIRFRADKKEGDLSFGKGSADGKLAQGNTPISVDAGMYTIKVNINNPADFNYIIEETDPINPELITAPEFETEFTDWAFRMSDKQSISWLALDFGEQREAAVEYQLEVDLKEGDFTSPLVLAKTKNLGIEISASNLFDKLKELKSDLTLDEEIALSWRVTATVSGLDDLFISEIKDNKVSVSEDPEYPETLYMIGESFGGWNWEDEGIVSLTPVHSHIGKFWTIKYIEKGSEFKWSPVRGWDGDFAGQDENIGFNTNGNATVDESGLYMIFIDLPSSRIVIEPAQVFGMGDAFGSWDEKKHAFSIEEDKMVYKPTLVSSELRMYAYTKYAEGVDWWQMEFILRDGVIEYRGAGNDQEPRVPTLADQRIELDFTTNSGVIK